MMPNNSTDNYIKYHMMPNNSTDNYIKYHMMTNISTVQCLYQQPYNTYYNSQVICLPLFLPLKNFIISLIIHFWG